MSLESARKILFVSVSRLFRGFTYIVKPAFKEMSGKIQL